MVGSLRERQIGFTSLHERLNTTTPGGRPTVVNDDLIRKARNMLPDPENSVEPIVKILGVSVGTLYNHVPT